MPSPQVPKAIQLVYGNHGHILTRIIFSQFWILILLNDRKKNSRNFISLAFFLLVSISLGSILTFFSLYLFKLKLNY